MIIRCHPVYITVNKTTGTWHLLPVVPLTTRVVTVGLTADTVTGVTSRTPPTVLIGTVRKIVPGCPGAPFKTT